MSTIYCFLEDTIFGIEPKGYTAEYESPGVGYLGDNEEAYFSTKSIVKDTRASRDSYTQITTSGLTLYFDSSKYTDNQLAKLDDVTTSTMFSILEYIELADTDNADDIEFELTTNPLYALVYVAESFRFSSTSTKITLKTDDLKEINIRDFFDITLKIDGLDTTLRIWSSRSSFLEGYPFSTITSIVLPWEHQYILNPDLLEGPIDSVIKSATSSFVVLNSDLSMRDQTGLLTYNTKYNVSSTGLTLLPFGVTYKGAVPNSLDIRAAIREKLLAPGIAPESVWKELLPDLFVTGQFFLVPQWNNTTTRPERIMYPSIIEVNPLWDCYTMLFPSLEQQYILDNLELLSVEQSEIYILSMSDPLNTPEHIKLLTIHPTYQYHSNQNSAHSYMEEHTKEFNIKLNRSMSVLHGESILEDAIFSTIDGLSWLSFVTAGVEYHVLSKESYQEVFGEG